MRHSRDRGTDVPRCTYDNLTNFMYAVFKVQIFLTDALSVIRNLKQKLETSNHW